MPVYVRPIDKIEVNPLFDDICGFFGFDSDVVDDYEPELSLIQYTWQQNKQVEIYTLAPEGFPGRVKDSNSTLGSSPYYIGLFHGRVMPPPDYDPLIVVTFRKYEEFGKPMTAVVLHTLIVHDEMFGTKKRKHDAAHMQWIRQRLINLIEARKSPDDYR
ncbi:hypothetical protein [Kalamiella sp. sgz302252]|uniref:hypothetical protein n=1 Tax=Pantoea sp. sgz302252 TaxID=3341827 RepID=UPI0036D37DC5